MQKEISKLAIKKVAIVVMATSLTGVLSACVGSNAVTEKVMEFNVGVVDNRYARGGVNILLTPIYALTLAVDVVVINSLEFWTGKNPVNGNPHIFDSKVKTQYEINDQIDPSLREAPLKPISNNRNEEKSVYSVQTNPINQQTIDYEIIYSNGEKAILRGEKIGEEVKFSLNGNFITTATMDELESYSRLHQSTTSAYIR